MLETRGLTKQFGGLTAVDSVDFTLESGELCSLIGPNGAGKTTFFNLLTGELTPTDGTISVTGDDGTIDITDAQPYETAATGIHRSYQITNLFPALSVLENVRLAVQAHSGRDAWQLCRNARSFADHYEPAYDFLERVGLAGAAEQPTAALSHGEKRSLEVGVAMAGDPDVLLLDEPTAGVSSEGIDEVVSLIEDVAADHTVLLIEHNMEVVMRISDRIAVLHRGELIADDKPTVVQNDEAVQEAYLGGYEEGMLA